MGDVIDSTLMHVNDLPILIPIPIPIHKQGLNLMTTYSMTKLDYLLNMST